MKPKQELVISADDLRNVYHLIPGSRWRAATTPVGPAIAAGFFKGWGACDPSMADDSMVHLCQPVLGMGDLNAVHIAQELHRNVMRSSRGMKRESALVYPKPILLNDTGIFGGIMMDDRGGVQVVEKRATR